MAEAGWTDGRQSEMAAQIARGTGRLLRAFGMKILYEMTLANGRRADIAALGRRGEIWIIEIKSSLADFRADHKWPEYQDYCDQFYFATHAAMDLAVFPKKCGLIIADKFGGQTVRMAPQTPLPAARRRAVTLRFARDAATRLHGMLDPGADAQS